MSEVHVGAICVSSKPASHPKASKDPSASKRPASIAFRIRLPPLAVSAALVPPDVLSRRRPPPLACDRGLRGRSVAQIDPSRRSVV
jgi:hypothetical protein